MDRNINRNEILKILKKFYNNSNLKFPKRISINAVEQETGMIDCKIILDTSCIKATNMQINCNAFEGWSIVIYTALKNQYEEVTVKLCLKPDTDSEKKTKHWARFLYRAKRFSEQYIWFKLSDELKNELNLCEKEFKEYKEKGSKYLNNIPKNAAGIKDGHNKENSIEAALAKEETLLKEVIGNKNIFDGEKPNRQLPVGLFKGSVQEENRVFPGSKSAIDLWSWKDDTFYVVELKTLNPMVGIITEIFFYANYMRDLLITHNFTPNSKTSKKEDRGYSNILNKEFKKINGIMLADKFHPVLANKADDILKIMNRNESGNVHYYMASYPYPLDIPQNNAINGGVNNE